MNKAMRKLILRTNALLLAGFATFGFTNDLLGYFSGTGSWQDQWLNNPIMIGFVEAHGLAFLVAFLLFRLASKEDWRTVHLLGAMTHLLLGTANLIFWQLFLDVKQLPLGYITTSFHWIFVAVHIVALLTLDEKKLAV